LDEMWIAVPKSMEEKCEMAICESFSAFEWGKT